MNFILNLNHNIIKYVTDELIILKFPFPMCGGISPFLNVGGTFAALPLCPTKYG